MYFLVSKFYNYHLLLYNCFNFIYLHWISLLPFKPRTSWPKLQSSHKINCTFPIILSSCKASLYVLAASHTKEKDQIVPHVKNFQSESMKPASPPLLSFSHCHTHWQKMSNKKLNNHVFHTTCFC